MTTPDPHAILTVEQIAAQAAPEFHLSGDHLCARFVTRNFTNGLDLVNNIAVEAEKWDHHPDLDLRYGEVTVWLISHDDGAITHRDIRMSRIIADIARRSGFEPCPPPSASA